MYNIDWIAIEEFILTHSVFEIYWAMFVNGGWLLLAGAFWSGALKLWVLLRQIDFLGKFKWIFLAVAIPKGNEQTPKAVEQIFAQLAGTHKTPDLEEAYLKGFMQRWFSFEIVSLEGYIQFIIGTESKRRDLVEAAVYAQYPDAEITEIEDYTKGFPTQFPNPEYECFGSEFVLTNKNWVYPVRTYIEFEHSTAEEVFKDPMAALLEAMSRIGKGEQIWLQILVKPIATIDWQPQGILEVKKLIHAPLEAVSTLPLLVRPPVHLTHTLIRFADFLVGTIFGGEAGKEEKKKEVPPSQMLFLSPGEKLTVEKIERKIGKIGFATKIRYVYIAKHEVFKQDRVTHALVGALKQFNDETANGFKPETKRTITKVHFFFKKPRADRRRRKLVRAFKNRSRWAGMYEYVLNIEELASIWHFPALTVRAPLMRKTEIKRGEPPADLPLRAAPATIEKAKPKPETPSNLPFGGE